MTRRRYSLILAIVGMAALVWAVHPAQAQVVTRQFPHAPCSVTASYAPRPAAHTIRYGGGVSCAGGGRQKLLDVVPQVSKLVAGLRHWYSISLAGLYQGPTPVHPLRLSAERAAVASHVYRVLAYGQVSLPDGGVAASTACAGACSGTPKLSISPLYRYAPALPKTVEVGSSPCYLTEDGPVFTIVNGSYVMSYGGWVRCGDQSARARLRVWADVAGSASGGASAYYQVAKSGISAATATTAGVALATARTALLGHAYRINAAADVTYAGRRYAVTVRSSTFTP